MTARASIRRAGRTLRAAARGRGRALVFAVAVLALGSAAWALLAYVGSAPAGAERSSDSHRFAYAGTEVRVEFLGEVAHDEIFEVGEAVSADGGLPAPRGADGDTVGETAEAAPSWLSFRYAIGDDEREVLVAQRPLKNHVSFDDVARAGAAEGDGYPVRVGGRAYPQGAMLSAKDGHDYRVRLPSCGQGTHAALSEWNLLIGGVHEGDRDFRGERFGWLDEPYTDDELNVGYRGSLNWCRDRWHRDREARVVRGYFHVSRFHATPSGIASNRLYWRPVLERVTPGERQAGPGLRGMSLGSRPQISADRSVRYFGAVPHEALFGDNASMAALVGLDVGTELGDGRAPWLVFQRGGDTLLVAAKPLLRSLSWDDIAAVGAARAGGESIRVDGEAHPQDAEVTDDHENRYRVRLLRCGGATLDDSSEWNRLIGGVHGGDADFVAHPGGLYGWIERPLADGALGIRDGDGSASWCFETEELRGERHAVNRGYLTVARYHLTESDFPGSGFGWRPVLELISQP